MKHLNSYRVVTLIGRMSRLQKRVALLLASVSEAGQLDKKDMEDTFPSGLLGELSCAHRHNYVEQLQNGKYVVTSKGQEILSWLYGDRPNAPLHWECIVRKACVRKP
jgi:hypothetical protein